MRKLSQLGTDECLDVLCEITPHIVNLVSDEESAQIDLSNVFVVWACKTLQNYKALLSTTVSGDGVYVEYTYNGDKQELYEDFYIKSTNRKIVEE